MNVSIRKKIILKHQHYTDDDDFYGHLKCLLSHARYYQGRIDPPKVGRGHATPVQPV